MDIKLLFEVFFPWCCNGAFASDDASNVTKIGKDKSDDTHAYKDTTHKVILRTFSYFLKIVTHFGQVLLLGRVIIQFLNYFWRILGT